jgi:hypothetical protein
MPDQEDGQIRTVAGLFVLKMRIVLLFWHNFGPAFACFTFINQTHYTVGWDPEIGQKIIFLDPSYFKRIW